MEIGTWIGVAVIVLIVLWVVGMYNGLVGLRNQVKEAWAQVDVQLKRRFDLIPNLMETVKGYMNHERETLEAVTQARAAVQSAGSLGDRAALVLTGDTPAAVSGLLKIAGCELTAGPAGRLAAVAGTPEALALVHFAVSDAHFEARAQAGVDR